jgi:hypothetical protein
MMQSHCHWKVADMLLVVRRLRKRIPQDAFDQDSGGLLNVLSNVTNMRGIVNSQ